jgi:hypothetical protein
MTGGGVVCAAPRTSGLRMAGAGASAQAFVIGCGPMTAPAAINK